MEDIIKIRLDNGESVNVNELANDLSNEEENDYWQDSDWE